jgi:glycosyltransferase involved in cell wall biosynthesis
LGDRFRFLGFRADVHSVMSAFDIFCLSSDHEGLPVALMEAKALGLPVVATGVGGIPEAVVDGVDGALVPPGDSDGLAEAVGRWALDLSPAGTTRKLVAREVRFDSSAAVAAQEAVYENSAGTGASQGAKR